MNNDYVFKSVPKLLIISDDYEGENGVLSHLHLFLKIVSCYIFIGRVVREDIIRYFGINV